MNIRVSHDARCHCIVRTNKQRSLILATFFFLIFVVVYLFIYLFFEWYFWGNFLSKNLSNRFITNRQTFLCIINTHIYQQINQTSKLFYSYAYRKRETYTRWGAFSTKTKRLKFEYWFVEEQKTVFFYLNSLEIPRNLIQKNAKTNSSILFVSICHDVKYVGNLS